MAGDTIRLGWGGSCARLLTRLCRHHAPSPTQPSAAPRTVGCTRGIHVARAASSSGLYGAFDTSGMETTKMNLFTALNDGMRAALEADDTAVRRVASWLAHRGHCTCLPC